MGLCGRVALMSQRNANGNNHLIWHFLTSSQPESLWFLPSSLGRGFLMFSSSVDLLHCPKVHLLARCRRR